MTALQNQSTEEQLRMAIALNRGVDLLKNILQDADKTVEHDETRRVNYLGELFTKVHRNLFQDWKGKDIIAPGEIESAQKRKALREAITDKLCANGAGVLPKGLFDENGFVVSRPPEDLAKILADFYATVRKIEPYNYGNKLTLDFFMVALSKLPAFAEVYPQGIDFRRLAQSDLQVFYNPNSSVDDLQKAFMNAMNPNLTKGLENISGQGYRKTPWPKHVKYVAGVPFLTHKTPQDGLCLVTVNGGLIPFSPQLEQELKDHFNASKLISNFRPIKNSELVGRLANVDELHAPGKQHIDGIKISDDAAPLFCLDINIMTGLRPISQDELIDFLSNKRNEKDQPLKLTDLNKKDYDTRSKEAFLHDLLGEINETEHPRIKQTVSIAYDHMNYTVKVIDTLRDQIIDEAKTRKEVAMVAGANFNRPPKLYITMGGAGSGKSSVRNIIDDETKGAFVEASLDDFRKKSDLYKVLIAADHHADDYTVVEPFAKNLREWVAQKAKNERLDLLYDGSGINYQPNYAILAAEFKTAHYDTQLIAVDASLKAAVERVNGRFEPKDGDIRKKRALPWIVVTGKHTRMPASFLQAVKDPNLNKVTLLSADGDSENDRGLIAETIDDQKHTEQEKSLLPSAVRELFQSVGSIFTRMMSAVWKEPNAEKALNEKAKLGNSKTYLTYPLSKNKDRVLAIYDAARFTKLMEKGLMNPHASSPETLDHTPATLPFYMPHPEGMDECMDKDKGAWTLRLSNEAPAAEQLGK